MKAVELWVKLKQAGVALSIKSDGKLAFSGSAESLGKDVVESMKAVRDELLAITEVFEERAAIMEFDGECTRSDAESKALAQVWAYWKS